MKKKLRNLISFVILSNASVSKGFAYENKIIKFFGTGYYMAYYFFNKKNASLESKRFVLKGDNELNRAVWNLMDTKGIKHMLKGLLVGMIPVKHRMKLFLKKTKRPLNLDYVKSLHDKIKSKKFSHLNDSMIDSHYLDYNKENIEDNSDGPLLKTSVGKSERTSKKFPITL
jgi:hypothetical protein